VFSSVDTIEDHFACIFHQVIWLWIMQVRITMVSELQFVLGIQLSWGPNGWSWYRLIRNIHT